MVILREITCVIELQAKLTAFFHRTSFLLERMTNRHTMVIQTWMLGRHILKNEQSVCAIVRKAPDTVVVDKI